jgi:hypothetical protein
LADLLEHKVVHAVVSHNATWKKRKIY